MNTTDNLLKIIHLLTPSEKKYFKQYIAARKDNKFYADIFDLLAKQQEYSPALLARRLKKTPKQISDAKAYLMQVLLKSLENFHTDTTPLIRVRNLINQAEIARIKDIPALAYELLDKAAAICEEGDYFLYLVAICKMRQAMYAKDYNIAGAQHAGEQVARYMTMEQNLLAYRDLHKKMSFLIVPRQEKIIDTSIEDLKADPLLQGPSTALSVTARSFYYRIMAGYHTFFGDREMAYQMGVDLYRLLQEHLATFEANQNIMAACLMDSVMSLHEDRINRTLFNKALHELEVMLIRIRPRDKMLYYQAWGGASMFRQTSHVAMSQFAEGVRYYHEQVSHEDEYANMSPPIKSLFLFESAFCFYFAGNALMATELIHEIEHLKVKILSSGKTFMRLRVILAMIAFDDGNKVTMDSQFAAAKRHAKENAMRLTQINQMHKTMTRLLQPDVSRSEIEALVRKSKTTQVHEKLGGHRPFHFDQWLELRAGRLLNKNRK